MSSIKFLDKSGLTYVVQKILQLLNNKVDVESGKGLSTNDFTTTEKNKLSGIESGAQVNVNADWSVTDSTSNAYILNKPTSLKASDVYAWAKASTKPTYTKSEVGLGNVDNTADSAKSVKYATSAGSATTATTATSATKATQDASGNNIEETYETKDDAKTSFASSFSIENHTITLKNSNGESLGTVVVPDNNTTYASLKNPYSITINGQKYDGSSAVTVGTLGAAYGGTGQTTLKNSANAFINALDNNGTTPVDGDYFISQYVGGDLTNTTYYRRPISALYSYITGKLPTVATSGSYSDLSDRPTIGSGTITITQGGTTKGSFTVNQTGNTTINLTDNNTTYSTFKGATSSEAGSTGLVPAPSSGKTELYLKSNGTWGTPTNTTYSSLKNPYAFSVSANGGTALSYDGSSAKTLSFTAGSNVTITSTTSGAITIAATNTNTHYTSKNVVGATTATSNTTTALTNGNVYLNSVENGAVTSTHKISGTGLATVTTDASGNIIINSPTNATTATTATKLGTATVGSTTKPFYLNAGTPTAFSTSVGNSYTPVYMSSGSITKCSSTIGAATTPVYMNAGAITKCSYTISKSVPSNALLTSTEILNFIYPVGSIYMSMNETDPGTLFGGTWTKIQSCALAATGTFERYGYKEDDYDEYDRILLDESYNAGSYIGRYTKNYHRLDLPLELAYDTADGNLGDGLTDLSVNGLNSVTMPYLLVHMWHRTA